MSRWTKPEDYTDKGIAWQAAKEWVRGNPITGIWIDEAGDLTEDMIQSLVPPKSGPLNQKLVIEPKRHRVEWGGHRSGKTARRMGFDLSSGPDKSARAVWINGRLWILG